MRINIILKRTLKTILFLVLLFVIISKGLEIWLEKNFEAMINTNPQRAYNVIYKKFDLDRFFTGVTLKELKIEPLNLGASSLITGQVDYATLNGLVWFDLLFRKRLSIQEIAFIKIINE